MNYKEARENFEKFLKSIDSNMITLVEDTHFPHSDNIFNFTVEINPDKYLHKNSSGSIILTDDFFNDCSKNGLIFMGQQPSFNNNKTIGWFILKFSEEK